MSMELLVKLTFVSTAVMTVIVFYLVACMALRLRRWFRILRRVDPDFEMTSDTTALEVSARETQVQQKNVRHGIARTMVVQYVCCSCFVLGVFLRCLAYLLLIALGKHAQERGCHLILQILTLLSGVEILYVYLLFWRRQRYLYFDFGWLPKWVSTWSWSAVVLMAVNAAVRFMLEIATWRYGVQYEISQHGCMTTEHSPSRNVTLVEWQLPNVYKVISNSVVAFYVLGLYFCLFFKYFCAAKERKSQDNLATNCMEEEVESMQYTFGGSLTRATFCAVIAFVVPILPPLIWWRFIPPILPAILVFQIDDAGFILQALAMIVSIDDWKETLRLKKITVL